MPSLVSTLTGRRARRGRPLAAAAAAVARSITFPWGGGYFGGQASAEQLMSTMGAVSTLFAIVERLQTSCASIEWTLYRKSASGNKEDRQIVKTHPSIDLWTKPNRHMTGRVFREVSQQHMELVGETPWIVVKAGTLPVELWPVRPDRCQPQPDPVDFISDRKSVV